MTPLRVLIDPISVDEYLDEYHLASGHAHVEAVLLQSRGTEQGNAAVELVILHDGQRFLAKTSHRLLDGAMTMITAALAAKGDTQ